MFHAQDPLTANALATLAAEGRIAGFARTVHHLDDHADPRLAALQDRGVRDAAALCCVSGLWRRTLRARYGRDAVPVGNGVDGARFSSGPRGMAERDLRARLGIPPDGRLVLALGGVEARKNTLGLLHGFALLRRRVPDVRLLVAGGATLLDHAAYRRSFDAGLAAHGIGDAVHLAGVVADADMPALYAMADVFACVSLNEGFGLCVIEALAAGRPVVVSGIEPFTEHLGRDDVLWADPVDPGSVASALAEGLLPGARGRFAALGPTLAAGFGWDRVAAAHGPVHASLARAAERFRPGAAGTWADGPARTEMSDA